MPNENFRLKFIKDNLAKAKEKHLDDWEERFVKDVSILIKRDIELTQKQFNTLKRIADKD